MNNATVTVKKGRKFDQVLEGARQVFMSDGYEGASVDDIARAAGVSKATLYSYFPDKRFLFMEVAISECEKQAQVAMDVIDTSNPPRIVLTEAANRLVQFFLSEIGQQVHRICVAESDRFPELGQKFYECGPILVREILMDYFHKSIARGELDIEDLSLAADQFGELCKTTLFPKIVFGIQKSFDPKEIDRITSGAVDMFLARYGT